MAIDPSGIRVALLAGGTSGEREISLASGAGAQSALEEAGFTVERIDPASRADLARLAQEPFDVAFLCLHGRLGEDGTIQGMLEVLGIPYTGSGVWSSATAMDKSRAKTFYREAGVPTPRSVTVRRGQQANLPQLLEELGTPVVVKPANEGSALGVSIVESLEAAEAALSEALALDASVLVEQFVAGTELTVAVLGNQNPQALPVIQIVPRGEFYDFDSKYAPGGSQHLCPAPQPREVLEKAEQLALAAHRALACRGMSRSDMILDQAGSLWVLETNTIPGMTETSLLPDAARAAGMSFAQLCTKLVELALEK